MVQRENGYSQVAPVRLFKKSKLAGYHHHRQSAAGSLY